MAAHRTSATRSGLISFFLNLASHIPSLASSRNNQIPNRSTASASHDVASPTRCPVVDDSTSVVEGVSLQIDDGATRTSSEHGPRSTTTAGSSPARKFDSSRPEPVHPVASLFQRQELGKAVLGFAVPMTTALLLNQYRGLTHLQSSAIAILICVGFTATWNGMLLHGIRPRVASALEYLGVGSILVAFFGLVSSSLPPSLAWVCWLCCGLSCLPFLLCLLPPAAAAEEESSAERLETGIV